jgi:hypothetical protein
MNLHADDEEVEGNYLEQVLLVLAQQHEPQRVSVDNEPGWKERLNIRTEISFFFNDNPPEKKNYFSHLVILYVTVNSLFCSNLTRLPFHFLVIFPLSSFFRIFLLLCSH